jgi:lysozyme family protein
VTPEEAFDRIMEWEGGSNLHNVPGDPGGMTKYGVSQRAYPDLNIALLTEKTARRIFEQDYWNRVKADELPEELRLPVVDFAFNAGIGRAVRTLQQSINLCKQAHGRTDFLEVDGGLGPITLDAVYQYPADRVANVMLAYRMEHYVTLAETGRAKFVHGWLRRAKGVHS